jgi:methionyl-tRNA formyltransferase
MKVVNENNIASLQLPEHFIQSDVPGTAIYSTETKSLIVRCKALKASYLQVTELQNEGKKRMEASKWTIGYRDRMKDGVFVFGQQEPMPQ